jgi:GNAT superfamily N-acetyltransferase
MAGYRFCRSDDIPLLVAAHDACWVPHFGADSAITVEDFKRGIREIGLWSSSCMVAFEGDEPIGVLIAAKRDGEANYVHRLAVKPGWERQGHGRHLLTSLVDKAAILGPPRVVAEIPAEWTEIRGFFERSGFVGEARYADFVRAETAPSGRAADDPRAALVIPIGFDELVESGADARRAARMRRGPRPRLARLCRRARGVCHRDRSHRGLRARASVSRGRRTRRGRGRRGPARKVRRSSRCCSLRARRDRPIRIALVSDADPIGATLVASAFAASARRSAARRRPLSARRRSAPCVVASRRGDDCRCRIRPPPQRRDP